MAKYILCTDPQRLSFSAPPSPSFLPHWFLPKSRESEVALTSRVLEGFLKARLDLELAVFQQTTTSLASRASVVLLQQPRFRPLLLLLEQQLPGPPPLPPREDPQQAPVPLPHPPPVLSPQRRRTVPHPNQLRVRASSLPVPGAESKAQKVRGTA